MAVTIKELLTEYRQASTPMAAGMLALMLSDAVAEDIAAREAEAKERRLPVDAEWLEPLCERVSEAKWYWYINEERGLYLIRWAGGFHLKLCDQTICDQANRGHVLYMMSALGLPVKTQ